ncbi:4Fe-4S ferredoxin [Pelagibaculum spongiae]|uniref:D-lactate dehydrogenase (cytochrome) n=2 Tax=Pelagibaculum spongiae TaxID=2080658 RepID=A0A2V1GSS7_9GAMM|nr:FAD-binding and (Fe-S)-binding domain-containing protein [Pelagibaculum spongiae]PVZ68449.1 4Fe-4S ferredoxin [Pelagibaculum spongiae]
MKHPSSADKKYRDYLAAAETFIDQQRITSDPLKTLAYGTDASFYRLIPQAVIKVDNEQEITRLLGLSRQLNVPVTFRAAGTSLSGQAITDSILITLNNSWKSRKVESDGMVINLQPGVIGADANAALVPWGRKIGPDPASINTCKIGGIAANNASGMCCGTAQNSYHTVAGMRLILADGALLDTRCPDSVAKFKNTHAELLNGLTDLAQQTCINQSLADKIRHKFRLKNTTGYSLNALVDYQDPLDILQHLMIGSEGTLGFISEISYHTVVEHPHKASTLVVFDNTDSACRAVSALKTEPVDSVEMMDRKALASVDGKPGMPDFISNLNEQANSLLIETRAATENELNQQIARINDVLKDFNKAAEVSFTADPAEFGKLWAIRKGLFPAVGGVREVGTTVIIEDIAFPVPQLAEAVIELQQLFIDFEYHNAIIFGHALEGNLHFVFTQGFETQQEIDRYGKFMDAVAHLVVNGYGGSLKAEHGTGRNMAPYVEMEWGSQAYNLMRQLKALLDPHNILNPGVILTDDPQSHLKNLKALPAADVSIDMCIECGFCEPVCPSRDITLTPRQRAALWREISRADRDDDKARVKELEQSWLYNGLDTCAACGMCQTRCPVGINIADLTRKLRGQRNSGTTDSIASIAANNYGSAMKIAGAGLSAAKATGAIIGNQRLKRITEKGHKMFSAMPVWPATSPGSASYSLSNSLNNGEPIVFFPSCASRTFGNAKGQQSQIDVIRQLLERAGYQLIIPKKLGDLCCGMPFESKGFAVQAQSKATQLRNALELASNNGQYPVLCDTSPCVVRGKAEIEASNSKMTLLDPVEFCLEHLLPRLTIRRKVHRLAVHATCSVRKQGLTTTLEKLASHCADELIIPEGIECCGFAGDRGFTQPELNASSLENLSKQIDGCEQGVSTSRTCEIGLTEHGGIDYRSIFHLLDECSREIPKPL